MLSRTNQLLIFKFDQIMLLSDFYEFQVDFRTGDNDKAYGNDENTT